MNDKFSGNDFLVGEVFKGDVSMRLVSIGEAWSAVSLLRVENGSLSHQSKASMLKLPTTSYMSHSAGGGYARSRKTSTAFGKI